MADSTWRRWTVVLGAASAMIGCSLELASLLAGGSAGRGASWLIGAGVTVVVMVDAMTRRVHGPALGASRS